MATPRALARLALVALLVVLCATRVDAQAARRVGGVARGAAGGARNGAGPRRFSRASFGGRARGRAGAGTFGARGGAFGVGGRTAAGRAGAPGVSGRATAARAARRVGPATPGQTRPSPFATATDPANDDPRRGAINEAPRPATTRPAPRVASRAGPPVDHRGRVATAQRDASLTVSSPRPVAPRDPPTDPARDAAFRQALSEAPRVDVRRGDEPKDGEESDRPTTAAKAATTTGPSETSPATKSSSRTSVVEGNDDPPARVVAERAPTSDRPAETTTPQSLDTPREEEGPAVSNPEATSAAVGLAEPNLVPESESESGGAAAAIESEPQKVVVGARPEGDAATTTATTAATTTATTAATHSIGSGDVAQPSLEAAAAVSSGSSSTSTSDDAFVGVRPSSGAVGAGSTSSPSPTTDRPNAIAEDPIATSGPRPQTLDRPASSDQQTAPIEVPASASASASDSSASVSSTPVQPSATPLPASFAASDPLLDGFARGGRAGYPLFGGGLDVGRGYAPRGFGGIPREPECESRSASPTPRPSAPRRDQPRAYVVRFFANVTAETFREVSREVETRRPATTTNETKTKTVATNATTDVRASATPLPASSPVSPRLRANAPGFRTATLVGLTATQKRAFHRARASEIELIEEDAEIFAYEFGAAATTTTTTTERARPSSTCAYAQKSLTASQWNLDRVAHASTRASRLDGAFEPPECLCGRGVHVFVLDTGVRVTHEDFRPPERVGAGWNFVGCGGEVDDQSGHGTHTAGTAVGATSGVAKCATLHPVQILDGEGKGKSSDVLSALDWVADRDVGAGARKVVSMSVGGPRSAAVDAAVREMVAMGVVVVAAAGNEGRDAAGVSPAGEPAAVTVGSTSCPSGDGGGGGGGRCASDAVSGFSNYGQVVDVYAPGETVRSAWRTGDDAYRVSSGTSMACPLVAGAAALYLEKFPSATPEDVARAIAATATPVTWGENEGGAGGGMLNLPAMLREPPK